MYHESERRIVALQEFLILRRGEPLLFGLSLTGATWVHPHVFERPIEKLGGSLELYWQGQLLTDDKRAIVSVLAHWKKQLNRRARKSGSPVQSIVSVEELSPEERLELMGSLTLALEQS